MSASTLVQSRLARKGIEISSTNEERIAKPLPIGRRNSPLDSGGLARPKAKKAVQMTVKRLTGSHGVSGKSFGLHPTT